jgi:hypothetical protein
VPDRVINWLRAVENSERPLKMTVEVVQPAKKKRKRRSRKTEREVDVTDNEILCVHSYSPIVEELRASINFEDNQTLHAFHGALCRISFGRFGGISV